MRPEGSLSNARRVLATFGGKRSAHPRREGRVFVGEGKQRDIVGACARWRRDGVSWLSALGQLCVVSPSLRYCTRGTEHAARLSHIGGVGARSQKEDLLQSKIRSSH